MDATRRRRLLSLKGKVNTQHGAHTMELAAKIRPLEIPRLPTGSLAFDFSLGGGLPAGVISLFWGEKSSGKSMHAYRIAGLCQGLCGNCLRPARSLTVHEVLDVETGELLAEAEAVCDCYRENRMVVPVRQMPGEDDKDFKHRVERYQMNSYREFRVAIIDAEQSFTRPWGTRMSVDSDRMMLVQPDTAEEAVDVYESLARTGAVDLFILDSIAALSTKEEIEKGASEDVVGTSAKLMNRMCREIGASNSTVGREFGMAPTHIWINQPRMKIGVKFGDPTTLPGGMGQFFFPHVEVKMWSSKWQIEKLFEEMNAELSKALNQILVGNRVRMNWDVKKNKTAPARIQAGYTMFITGDHQGKVDELGFVYAMAERYGFVAKDKTKWLLGEEEFKTKGSLMARLQEPEVWAETKRALMVKMQGEV